MPLYTIQLDVCRLFSDLIVQLSTTMLSAQLAKSKLIYNSIEQFYMPLVNSPHNSFPLTFTSYQKKMIEQWYISYGGIKDRTPASHWGGREGGSEEVDNFEKILV